MILLKHSFIWLILEILLLDRDINIMGIPRSEKEDYRPTVSEAMQKVMGFTDNGVVTAALKCLSQKLDKASMISKLYLYKLIPQVRIYISLQVHAFDDAYLLANIVQNKSNIA